MTIDRATRIASADISYQRLVQEAAFSILNHGAVDMETAIVADSLGYSIDTLTTDAESRLDEIEALRDELTTEGSI